MPVLIGIAIEIGIDPDPDPNLEFRYCHDWFTIHLPHHIYPQISPSPRAIYDSKFPIPADPMYHQPMKLSRRAMLGIAAPVLAGGVAAAYGGLIEPHHLSLERVEVAIADLPAGLAGLRIAVLSDFHLHPFTKLPLISEAVAMANGLRADVVVLLGDFVDAAVDAIDELAPELAKLNARHGIFAVLGNHDHWKGAKVISRVLHRHGISVLTNMGVVLPCAGGALHLAGVDSAWAGKPDLNSALAAHRPGIPTVLLAHEPDFADTAAADGRISLQLSGHSHGGQIRLPIIGALELPSWGRRYDQGLYQVGGMSLYTNRGIGLVDIPIRFNCPPEVTEITLVPGSGGKRA